MLITIPPPIEIQPAKPLTVIEIKNRLKEQCPCGFKKAIKLKNGKVYVIKE